MIETVPQTPDGGVDGVAACRILPWERGAGVPVIPGHTYPRLVVALEAPGAAEPLFRRMKADLRAIRQHIDAEHQARVQAAQQQYAGGDLTPNQRGHLMAEAEQEHATRLERVEGQYAALGAHAALQRAKDAAQAAIDQTWRDAIAAYHDIHAA